MTNHPQPPSPHRAGGSSPSRCRTNSRCNSLLFRAPTRKEWLGDAAGKAAEWLLGRERRDPQFLSPSCLSFPGYRTRMGSCCKRSVSRGWAPGGCGMLEKLLEPMLSQARELRGCSCSQHTAGDTRGPRKRWECPEPRQRSSSACAEPESLVALPVQLPGRGRDPIPTFLPAGRDWAVRRGDMGWDTRPLTCCPDLHRARADLREPLQADAVFHRPGDRAVPGRGE